MATIDYVFAAKLTSEFEIYALFPDIKESDPNGLLLRFDKERNFTASFDPSKKDEEGPHLSLVAPFEEKSLISVVFIARGAKKTDTFEIFATADPFNEADPPPSLGFQRIVKPVQVSKGAGRRAGDGTYFRAYTRKISLPPRI